MKKKPQNNYRSSNNTILILSFLFACNCTCTCKPNLVSSVILINSILNFFCILAHKKYVWEKRQSIICYPFESWNLYHNNIDHLNNLFKYFVNKML